MKLRYIKPFDWLFLLFNATMIYIYALNGDLSFIGFHLVMIGSQLFMCSHSGKKSDEHKVTMARLNKEHDEILARTNSLTGRGPVPKPKLSLVDKEN